MSREPEHTDMSLESSTFDPYAVLGVGTEATEEQVRKAWRKKTKVIGPGSAAFTELNEAAELLLDPARRAEYDAVAAQARVAEARAAAESAPTVVEETPAPTSPEPAVAGPGRLRRAFAGWNGTALIAGLLAVVAVALAIWQGIAYSDEKSSSTSGPGTGGVAVGSFAQSQSDQQAALSAVTTGLPAVLSYNYASMTADQANAVRFLSPKARPALIASYQRLINGGTPPGCKTALPPIATRKTVVVATVVTAGIVSVGTNTAQIGAFVNQKTTNGSQAAVTTQNRVLVSLVKQGGSWLIDSLSVPNTDHVLTC
ncbi:MAG: J domain-containing protein [Marmoricola sp.]